MTVNLNRLFSMKFSYRVIALGLVVLIITVLYYTWDSSTSNAVVGHTSPIHSVHSSVLSQSSRLWPVHQYEVPVAENEELCRFQSNPSAQADVKTLDVLQLLNDERKTRSNTKDIASEKVELDPNEKRRLEVIVLPHSHSDPGWLKTVNEYFEEQTRPTLDNMVEKLSKYPDMTFVWAESVFFSMWWDKAAETQRATVKRLLQRGQLEIAVGSWVVPDEANTHYFALIDQMIEGHQFLERTVGAKPNVTWSLDPFGYSSTLPYLYKRAGYENMVILRVHKQVKEKLQKKKYLEFLWRQAWDGSGRHDMQTLMMPYMLYNIKHSCGPHHYVCLQFDFRNIPGEISESKAVPIGPGNIEKLSKLLLNEYRMKAALYRHNVVLVPLGDDFRYDRAVEWDQQYSNYMKLFSYMNNRKEWNVRARFGTISDYVKLVHQRTSAQNNQVKLPVLSGDFFPYTDQDEEYWTGYFTSRPFVKNLGREMESYLRAADIVQSYATSLARFNQKSPGSLLRNVKLLESARRSLGLFQHHDGVTGTAKDFVMDNYEEGLIQGLENTKLVMLNSLQYLLSDGKSDVHTVQEYVLDMDDILSLKPLLVKKKVFSISVGGTRLILYNPVAQRRQELVRVFVNTDVVEVKSDTGDAIPTQLNPVWNSKNELSITEYELVFYVDVPALSVTTYTLVNSKGKKVAECVASSVRMYNVRNFQYPRRTRFNFLPPSFSNIVLENPFLRAVFSYRDGYLRTLTTKHDGNVTRVNVEFMMYKSRGSGAYIFYPAGPAIGSEFTHRPVLRVVKGPLMSEVQVLLNLVTHRVTLTNSTNLQSSALEIFNVVDITKMTGKELIMRVTTNISSDDTFYTDMNGYQMVRRKFFKNFPLQANYYPMTTTMHIQDKHSRLSLVTTQPHGVTSVASGQFEAMLDRRLTLDDGRGLGEGVLDNRPTPSRFLLILERRNQAMTREVKESESLNYQSLVSHTLANQFLHPVLTFLQKEATSRSAHSVTPPAVNFRQRLSLSPISLPCDIQLINIRSLSPGTEHLPSSAAVLLNRVSYQCGFRRTGLLCSVDEKGAVDVGKIFKSLHSVSAVEMTLSLMHEKRKLSTDVKLELAPMELYAYKLLFP